MTMTWEQFSSGVFAAPPDATSALPPLSDRMVGAARVANQLLRRYHAVRFDGLEHLPSGPVLLVGNHGRLGYETMLFFDELLARTGRHPRGLADRWFFRVPGIRDALTRLGGIRGNRQSALTALAEGHLVVCYPGGAREVFKSGDSYRLQWEQSLGFVRVAQAAGVPIVPFAAAGVDDTYDAIGVLRGSGALMMGHDKYDLPVLRGRGPLPRPVPFWFRLGEPITVTGDGRDDDEVACQHRAIWSRSQSLLDGLVGEWRSAQAVTANVA